jgi:hypothetical protein
VKFDRDGITSRLGGKYGTGAGEFNLPHPLTVDDQGRVHGGGRENQAIQIFDSDGKFLRQWAGIGCP